MTRALLLLPALLLGGCISLLPKPPPPPATYVLEAGQVARAEGVAIDKVVAVAQPDGDGTLLGNDLTWRTNDTTASVAATAWSNRAEDALQAMLVQTMSQQHRFRAAVRLGGASSDYLVRWTLVNFDVDESRMQARFVADVVLLGNGRRVIASERVSAEAPVADRAASIAAQALTRAAREGSARIGLFAADAAAEEETRLAAEAQARAASINR